MLALLIADRPALLPLTHDEPVVQLLTAILHGSEAVKAETGKKSVLGLVRVQQVRNLTDCTSCCSYVSLYIHQRWCSAACNRHTAVVVAGRACGASNRTQCSVPTPSHFTASSACKKRFE